MGAQINKNEIESIQKFKSNERISFITLNFTGIGNNKIDIIGTDALVGVKEIVESVSDDEETYEEPGGGCLIATATFGSELAPQVQQLRELRDNKLLATESGKSFITSFNTFYYSFSPVVADYERENPVFKEMVKISITPMITSLSLMENANSEVDPSSWTMNN